MVNVQLPIVIEELVERMCANDNWPLAIERWQLAWAFLFNVEYRFRPHRRNVVAPLADHAPPDAAEQDSDIETDVHGPGHHTPSATRAKSSRPTVSRNDPKMPPQKRTDSRISNSTRGRP